MPIMPSDKGPTTWIIFFSKIIDGEKRHFKEEFTGTIKDAMFHEMQIRGLIKDGMYSI